MTKTIATDIDIDFADRNQALKGLQHVIAVELHQENRQSHRSGVYFQDIPIDPIDKMAVWEYEDAEEKGFFKIDFLNNSIYQGVQDENHLIELMLKEPPWEVLQDKSIVSKLAQIAGHFDVVQEIQPKSVEDLAVCIALIRPGKKHLIGKTRQEIDNEIWTKSGNYHFKKAHAISAAASIVVQLNLLIELSLNEHSQLIPEEHQ